MDTAPQIGMIEPESARRGAIPDGAPLRVLIVEDAEPVAALLEAALRGEGMVTELALSGRQAIAAKLRWRPDVVLIDLGLPDVDGRDLIGRFAADGDCGIIVVTAHDAEGARIAGLETGADDYMVKPAPLKELAARIRAVHRRLTRPSAAGAASGSAVTLDWAHRRLSGPGRLSTPLTEAEFAAFVTLLEADGASVSRDWLGRVALKRPLAADDRSVDQLVLKLRRKLALHGVPNRSILSSRGLGYVVPEPGRFSISTAEEPAESTGAAPGGRAPAAPDHALATPASSASSSAGRVDALAIVSPPSPIRRSSG